MRILANAFLVVFAIEAFLTLLSSQWTGAESTWFENLRLLSGGVATVVSLPVFALLGFNPNLRWRIFLPPCLLLSWVAVGAMPLSIWLSVADARLAVGALEVLLAVMAFAFCRQQNGGKGWLLGPEAMHGPTFSGRTAVGFTALNLLAILPASLAYLAFSAAVGVGYVSAGFVEIRTDGIHLSHREYARDGRRIHLVAMMHVGDPAFYQETLESFPTDGAIILAEGVRDETGLLSEGLNYGNLAAGLGLVVQPELDDGDRELRYADVDVSEFSPRTLALLAGVARVFGAETFGEAFREYAELSDMSSEVAAESIETLKHDLIDLRNDHLLAEVEAALADYDVVVVPWGALHLPGIQQRVIELGFEQTAATDRRVVSW